MKVKSRERGRKEVMEGGWMDWIVFLGPADSNNTSGLRETDSRDLPQRRQHIYEEMELPEQRDKTKSTAGGLDGSFYSSASGTAQEETSRSNKTKYLHQQH